MAVFSELYASEYDTLYTSKDYSGECDLIEAALARFSSVKPRSMLDVGCGTGGHSIDLAGRGYAMTGVDLSPSMIDIARAKAATAAADAAPTFACGDARDFSFDDRFDAAIMMFAVVSYLNSNEDVLSGLRNIRRHLKPGALFLCDFWYGPAVLSVRPSERVRVLENGPSRTIRAASTEVDSFHQTADVSFRLWTLTEDRLASETAETHRMRYFFPQEFALFLESAGFENLHYSEFPHLDAPLTDNTWNAFCVARAV